MQFKHEWIPQYLDPKQAANSIHQQWIHLDPKATMATQHHPYSMALAMLGLWS